MRLRCRGRCDPCLGSARALAGATVKTKAATAEEREKRFQAYYADREAARIARGEISPEAIGRLEAQEQVAREREQLAAMLRSYGE